MEINQLIKMYDWMCSLGIDLATYEIAIVNPIVIQSKNPSLNKHNYQFRIFINDEPNIGNLKFERIEN